MTKYFQNVYYKSLTVLSFANSFLKLIDRSVVDTLDKDQ